MSLWSLCVQHVCTVSPHSSCLNSVCHKSIQICDVWCCWVCWIIRWAMSRAHRRIWKRNHTRNHRWWFTDTSLELLKNLIHWPYTNIQKKARELCYNNTVSYYCSCPLQQEVSHLLVYRLFLNKREVCLFGKIWRLCSVVNLLKQNMRGTNWVNGVKWPLEWQSDHLSLLEKYSWKISFPSVSPKSTVSRKLYSILSTANPTPRRLKGDTWV